MGLSHSPRIVTNGLVLCLDAANIKSYPGSGTTWTDLSGNGNNGTLTNGPTFGSGNGGSIVFDGVNDLSNQGSSSTLSLTTSGITIDSWVYPTGFGGSSLGRIVNRSQGSVSSGYMFFVGTGTPNNYLNSIVYFTGAGAVGTDGHHVTNAIVLNTWHHLCVTHVFNGTLSFYKNGSLLASYSAINGPSTVSDNCYIGNRGAADRGFSGNISSVKIYNRVLSAAEILQNFNATRGRYGI